MDNTNIGKLEIGDCIVCKGLTITIAKIYEQDHYDRCGDRPELWYIDFVDTNGKYRSWHSAEDGGRVIKSIKVTDEAKEPSEMIEEAIDEIKEAHEPYLVQLIQTMAAAKQQFDKSIFDKIDKDPTADDIQIVIEGQAFNVGSMYVDICDLVYSLLDDIQKFAANEIL
jgi:hypothetical protein